MPQYSGVWSLQQQMQALTSGQWVTDPLFDYTTLLLQGDAGANGAQNNVFYDTSPNQFAITRNGNTTQGTFSPFSLQPGEWSNYFPGSASISFSTSSGFNIDTYDCFECWVNFSSLGTSNLIAGREANFWMAYNHASIGGASNKFVFAIYNGSSWQAVSSNTTPVVGTWYHIAGIRDSGTLRLYINGVQENTATFSGSPSNNPAYNFFVGALNAGESMTGYVSNVRLVTGSTAAVLPYTANFTPSPRPLTAVTGTQILTCQGSRFFDANTQTTAKTLGTITSTPSVQAFSPFAPQFQYTASGTGGSGYFDGTGDFLSSSGSINWSTHTNITINLWVYPTNLTGSAATLQALVGTSHAQNDGYTVVYIYNDGKFAVGINGTNEIASAAGVVKANTWSYLSVVKSGSTTTLYVNGTSVATNTTGVWSNNSATVYVGNTNTQLYTGYMSGLSIVLGTATAPSGVPTSPPTNITNTNTLLNFTNAGILDGTMKNNLETVGNAQISTSVVKYGSGSMYFDGTGDYLSIPASKFWYIGTGDYTIEAWIYPTAWGDILSCFNTSSPYSGWNLQTGGATGGSPNGVMNMFISNGTTFVDYNATTVMSLNRWTHIAVVKSGTTLYQFINGVLDKTSTGILTPADSNNVLLVGISNLSTRPYTGYIDDLRITKGVARYMQSFIPPSVALPRQ